VIDTRLVDGRVEAIAAAAPPLQGDCHALDAVHACSERLLRLLPFPHLRLIGAQAHGLFRMGAQVDERGHGKPSRDAFQLDLHIDLGRQGTLELAPRLRAREGKLRGEHFFQVAHEIRALRGRLMQDERVVSGRAGVLQRPAERFRDAAEPSLAGRPSMRGPGFPHDAARSVPGSLRARPCHRRARRRRDPDRWCSDPNGAECPWRGHGEAESAEDGDAESAGYGDAVFLLMMKSVWRFLPMEKSCVPVLANPIFL